MRSDAFIDAVHSLSREKLEAALDPEVKFFSPVSFRSYDGRDLVVLILTEGPMKLFEDFEYVHTIEGPDEPTAAPRARVRPRQPQPRGRRAGCARGPRGRRRSTRRRGPPARATR